MSLYHEKKTYTLPDNIIGKYNYENALSAIAVCKQLKISISSQIKALTSFNGVNKRMEFVGYVDDTKVFDDFAHHPTAIKCSINAIKEKYNGKRLLTIFIPGSNSMNLGVHNNELISSLNKSTKC